MTNAKRLHSLRRAFSMDDGSVSENSRLIASRNDNNHGYQSVPITPKTIARFRSADDASDRLPIGDGRRARLNWRSSDVFTNRDAQYDADANNLFGSGIGERVWYDNYTTIDWLHDSVKDAQRRKKVHSIKGIRGKAIEALDALQGWLIVGIIGVCTAVIAYCVNIFESRLFDWKEGYCTTYWLWDYSFCCRDVDLEDTCPTWKTWSEVFRHTSVDSQNIDHLVWTVVAVILATVSCLLTLTTKSVPPNTNQNDNLPKKVTYLAAGSGIPEVKVILSGFVLRGSLGLRTLIVKAIGLTLSVASGLSLGKEGPFVHIACCVGNVLCRLWTKYGNNEGKRREILSASSAAGVAVAFAAPIGGVLFSLEEVSHFFPPKTMWRSYFCAIIAVITLKMLNPNGTGKIVVFEVSYHDHEWKNPEIVIFLLLGMLGGVYGALFCKLNMMWSKSFRTLNFIKKNPLLEVLGVVLLTAIVTFRNPYTRLSGPELVGELFSECSNDVGGHGFCGWEPSVIPGLTGSLFIALAIKIILTIITFGIKVPAGIFIPTLAVGAIAGRIAGLLVQYAFFNNPQSSAFSACHGSSPIECIVPGTYALVGAAAALAGVTRMTVSLAVIMFELTGSLNYVTPLMIAILVSKWTADAIEPNGIYNLCIDLQEFPYLETKTTRDFEGQLSHILARSPLAQISTLDVSHSWSLRADLIREKLNLVHDKGYNDGGFPIVRDGLLVGYIAISELEHALDIMVAGHPHFPISELMCQFGPFDDKVIENSSIESFLINQETTDFRQYVDQSPISLSKNAPIALVFEMFVKLGLRYLCVTENSEFFGVVHKKAFLAYLKKEKEKGP